MNTFYAIVVLTAIAVGVESQTNAVGKTTRYWDCCKASCGWAGKGSMVNSKPLNTCAKDGVTVVDPNTQNTCGGGGITDPKTGSLAYMCANNQPWAVNDTLACGFVAGAVAGKTESDWCCACYELTFTDSLLGGKKKKMVVQVTNTGGDLSSNHFDIQIPGGGVGIFNGCTSQYGAPADGWGSRYGGVSSAGECSQLPSVLQPGCNFRFGWFSNADNPPMTMTRTVCPKSIVAKTGCRRSDDSTISGIQTTYANI